MVIYWYPLSIALICTLILCWALATGKKKWAIAGLMVPVFFASPFITVTRGAAGAITCSDMTGLALLAVLLFFPGNWRSTRRPVPAWPFVLLFLMMMMSIWTSGLYYNFIGIKQSQSGHLRVAASAFLPVYMAGFRTLKLMSLGSYCFFFYILFLDDDSRDWLLRVVILGTVLVAVAKTMTLLGLMDLSLSYGDTGGVYIGPRILGHAKATIGRMFYIGILLSLARYDKGSKLGMTTALVVLTGGLVLSGSRAGIFALIISFVPIYLFGGSRGFVIGIIALTVVILAGLWALSFSDMMRDMLIGTFDPETVETASTRLPIWKDTLSLWLTNPMIILFGVGAFNFSYAGLPVHFEHAHNDMLSIGTELGITGVFILLIILITIFAALFRNVRQTDSRQRWFYLCLFAMFFGLMFASQFEATFYPTISALPMLRIMLPLIFAASRLTDINDLPEENNGFQSE